MTKINSLLEKMNINNRLMERDGTEPIKALSQYSWDNIIKKVNLSDKEAENLAKDLGYSSFSQMKAKNPPDDVYRGDPEKFTIAFKTNVIKTKNISDTEFNRRVNDMLNSSGQKDDLPIELNCKNKAIDLLSKYENRINEGKIQDEANKLAQNIAKQVSKLQEQEKTIFLFTLINDLHGNPLTRNYMEKL